jgi:hypothetical protein
MNKQSAVGHRSLGVRLAFQPDSSGPMVECRDTNELSIVRAQASLWGVPRWLKNLIVLR